MTQPALLERLRPLERRLGLVLTLFKASVWATFVARETREEEEAAAAAAGGYLPDDDDDTVRVDESDDMVQGTLARQLRGTRFDNAG